MKNGLFHKKIARFTAVWAAVLFIVSCGTTGGGSNAQSGQSAQSRQVGQGGQAVQPVPAAVPVERNIRGNVPQFVKNAVKNIPEDAWVGIGTAKMTTVSLSRTTAATRGRAEISRQILSFMQDMVRDYQAASEVDPSAAIAYQENFTLALSKSALQGSAVVDEDQDANGAYWVVVMMPKDGAAREISQADAAAKLKAPAMASFDAQKRMYEAFDKLMGQEIQVQEKD